MESFVYLFFRRMRVPLIVLISAYAIATAGFALIPGVDDQGEPWRMSLLNAFYVVSYTGSTIGFGEVPYDFTQTQRLWTIVSIYLTVVAWLFSIGSIIALLQDPACRDAIERARLKRSLRRINQPFYIICGYGDTGRMLTAALSARGQRVVVIETQREKTERLILEDLGATVPAFCMDARMPDNLVKAGLRSRWCAGVLAVTGSDQANLKIAIAARLLNHHVGVYARADSAEVAANMRSFGTHHVVNPVDEFTRRLVLAIQSPDTFRLVHWLASGPKARIPRSRMPPHGRWILCGFGRLGRSMYRALEELGLEVVVVDPDPDGPGRPAGTVPGKGTQAETLSRAGIDRAAGILALTGDDADNLSIVITARELNPDVFLAVRENGRSNNVLFSAAEPDFIGRPSSVIAGTMLAELGSTLFTDFIERVQERDNEFSRQLLERLEAVSPEHPPEFSTVRVSLKRAPALAEALERGEQVTLEELCRDPRWCERTLPLVVLMVNREGENHLCPAADLALCSGDRVVLAGTGEGLHQLYKTLGQERALYYVRTGQTPPHGWLLKRLAGIDPAPATPADRRPA